MRIERVCTNESRILAVAQRLIGLDENIDRRALLDLFAARRSRIDEVLLDDALALLHETRAEFRRVDSHLSPSTHAVRHAQHIRMFVRRHEPSNNVIII
jgi:hypothetical protein